MAKSELIAISFRFSVKYERKRALLETIMKASQSARSRQQAIVKHLRSVGRAQVDELANLFRATPQTIRKDLKALATEG